MEYLAITIAVLTSLVTIRKIWHDGTKSKQEAEKIRLENKKMRRGDNPPLKTKYTTQQMKFLMTLLIFLLVVLVGVYIRKIYWKSKVKQLKKERNKLGEEQTNRSE
ncbi:hypothetical protein ACQKP0_19270 [Heyndrickxia sp. NPDC080065]|uniref:hypothetical protein n=1 Tax=Heyndrickxia sp. NPDC080065 TaxID=3390568 RepID=UPI003D080232